MKIDLHMHTNASDGTDEPRALVQLVAGMGFQAMAITDHDTMRGVDEAMKAGAEFGISVIPGIELSAGGEAEVHVLGYGVQNCGALSERMDLMGRQRDERMREMIRRLNGLGIEVTREQVMAKASGAVGRAHLARALVDGGYVRSVKEAFARYLSPGRPGYVPREKVTVAGAIELIRRYGGVPVVAHPGIIEMDLFYLPERVRGWKRAGLMGVEVYHPAHTQQQCASLLRLALSERLLVTGGSDYHGAMKSVAPGAGVELWASMERDFGELLHKIDLI